MVLVGMVGAALVVIDNVLSFYYPQVSEGLLNSSMKRNTLGLLQDELLELLVYVLGAQDLRHMARLSGWRAGSALPGCDRTCPQV